METDVANRGEGQVQRLEGLDAVGCTRQWGVCAAIDQLAARIRGIGTHIVLYNCDITTNVENIIG